MNLNHLFSSLLFHFLITLFFSKTERVKHKQNKILNQNIKKAQETWIKNERKNRNFKD